MASWNESLKIGVPKIDAQHQELCNAVDNLLAACSAGKGRAEVMSTMDFLEKYVIKHFSEEEAWQAQSKYPKCAQHKQIHTDFIKQLSKIKADINQNGTNIATVSTLNKMLLDWLINHIKKVDHELGEYIK